MIYRFKSKAASDLLMLSAHADQILHLMGKQPSARGIIEVHQMPAALDALMQAIVTDDALHALEIGSGQAFKSEEGCDQNNESDRELQNRVTLRQRAWPMISILKAALAEKQDIIWET